LPGILTHGFTSALFFVCLFVFVSSFIENSHGTVPLQEGEATYVRATIFEDRASFEKWLSENADDGTEKLPGQARPAEMVLYEGTLVINST
jgi:hypothetical protein